MKFQSSKPVFITLETFGSRIEVSVRHSIKAKRIAIKIGLKGAELIIPSKYIHTNKGYEFLLEKELWIRQKLAYLTKQNPFDKTTLPIYGKNYSIKYIDSDYQKVLIIDDTISVYSLPYLQGDILKRYLKNMLLEEINEKTTSLKNRYNLSFTKIKIIDNKTKWGSCSSKGELSFNWRLVFAPKEVVQYLVAHEMSHLKEMNHSRKFWNLVKEIYPDYKKHKLWLRENSFRLYQYLQAPINIEDTVNTHQRLQTELSKAC